MGIFDFMKDIGKKADNEDKLEASLQDAVKKAGLGLQNFQLKFDKGVATLSGTATTQKDLELARLIVGNHRGVEKVNDDNLKVAAYPPGQSVPRTPLVYAQGQAPGAQASDQGATAGPAPSGNGSQRPAKMVTVKKGDTLSEIAKQYLGDALRYPEIFEANRPMLKDPDEIYPGQVLRVPEGPTQTAH